MPLRAIFYFLLTGTFILTGCGPNAWVQLESNSSNATKEKDSNLRHLVLCWLKEPGNQIHRKRIIDVSESFRDIPGVLEVYAGEVVKSERQIVDDSFDIGILIVTKDGASLQEYLEHPIHQDAKQEVLLPLVDKVLVYDFQ